MSAQVIVFPRGQLSDVDRASLKDAGLCVVEADDPRAVVTHLPSSPPVTANAMLLCALQAMSNSSGSRADFTEYLTAAMAKAAAR